MDNPDSYMAAIGLRVIFLITVFYLANESGLGLIWSFLAAWGALDWFNSFIHALKKGIAKSKYVYHTQKYGGKWQP